MAELSFDWRHAAQLPIDTRPHELSLGCLSDLASRATAVLIPLNVDGVGADSHGGRLPDPEGALEGALDALIEAGALAGRLRANAGRCSASLDHAEDPL